MPMRTAIDYGGIEPGMYRARLSGVEDVSEGGFGPYTKWFFALEDEDWAGPPELRANSSQSFAPQAKGRAWAEALFGRKVKGGESIELESLVGRECCLMIRLEETDQGTFPRVDSVNPVRRGESGQGAKKGPPNPPDDSGEDFKDLPF